MWHYEDMSYDLLRTEMLLGRNSSSSHRLLNEKLRGGNEVHSIYNTGLSAPSQLSATPFIMGC
jgi:hypothetical protein